MTKTQIEELERAFPPVGRGDTVTLTMTRAEHGHVRRLLEERKRLLEALRPFTEGAGAMTYRKMMYEYGMEHVVKQTDAALAAVAFAEEAAR